MIIADTVTKQVYELIKNMILERQLKPGERIDPKAIAEANKVSLMPVRNALQQLTAQGLVVTQQRVGIFVREFSKEDTIQIYDTRKMFELYCLEHYFDNIPEREVRYLYQRQNELDSSNGKAMRIIDDNLHSMIVNASQNAFLIKQYADMNILFHISFYNDSSKTDAASAKEEHLRLLDAIANKDRERALNELERHLDRASQEVYIDIINEEKRA